MDNFSFFLWIMWIKSGINGIFGAFQPRKMLITLLLTFILSCVGTENNRSKVTDLGEIYVTYSV